MRGNGRPHVVSTGGAFCVARREPHAARTLGARTQLCAAPLRQNEHPPAAFSTQKRRQCMNRPLLYAAACVALGFIPARAASQGREVTGHVIRAVGQVPVGGATVIEVGGQGVTQSGPDGAFRIAVAAGEVRLLVRAIAYERKVVVVNPGEANVVVSL